MISFVLFLAGSAFTQEVDKEKLKKKAQEQSEKNKGKDLKGKAKGKDNEDLKAKADAKRGDIEDEDDGGHTGAIIGGIAAAAVVGTVIAKKSGGDDDDETETTLSFGTMDANKDGKLSQDEFRGAMSKGFEASDKNGDDEVTRDEAVAAYGAQGGKYFDALDSGKAGSISMDALEKDAAEAFHWADKNGDGSITADERSKATSENAAAEKEQKANPGMKAKKLLRKVT
jgi:Ca2+-binding EF-hand superfamily protein